MLFMKIKGKVVPSICVAVLIMSLVVIGQPAEKSKGDSAKAVMHSKHLKPQTTCPVSGDPIDSSQYVDFNGKRIYVCCSDCADKVKKNPEKYIKKLESMGQSVEIIGDKIIKGSKNVKADTSMKGMNMKGMKMKEDTSAYWTCTMHPEIHKAAPGNCPICGMKLVFKKSERDTTKTQNMDHSKMKM